MYSNVDIPDNKVEPIATNVTIRTFGLLIGWQWFESSDFAIGLAFGFDYYFNSSAINSVVAKFNRNSGVMPTFRFDIGYQW